MHLALKDAGAAVPLPEFPRVHLHQPVHEVLPLIVFGVPLMFVLVAQAIGIDDHAHVAKVGLRVVDRFVAALEYKRYLPGELLNHLGVGSW